MEPATAPACLPLWEEVSLVAIATSPPTGLGMLVRPGRVCECPAGPRFCGFPWIPRLLREAAKGSGNARAAERDRNQGQGGGDRRQRREGAGMAELRDQAPGRRRSPLGPSGHAATALALNSSRFFQIAYHPPVALCPVPESESRFSPTTLVSGNGAQPPPPALG